MLGRMTRIVCLAATMTSVGFIGSAHAQSMDMMSALMMSNRFVTPAAQYQPVSFTSEDTAKATDNKAPSRAAAPSDRAAVKANAQTRHADASLRPAKASDPR
ncbi:MAG TPA: hypothetical protein VIG90_02990 [Pedomonas sp.]|uniref:hypothetical protein n=1 Tax=Pedomonas sp. TaxID=2976421 RepID=UPI002F3EDBB9